MKAQILEVAAATVLAIIGVSIIMTSTDPALASTLVKAFFIVALSMAVWGSTTLALYGLYYRFASQRNLEHLFYKALGQAFVFVVVGIIAGIIQHLRR